MTAVHVQGPMAEVWSVGKVERPVESAGDNVCR